MKNALVLLAALALVGCEAKSTFTSYPSQTNEVSASILPLNKTKIAENTACVKGIVYFVVIYPGAGTYHYVTSPVIDPATLQPTRCNKESQ